MAAVSAESRKSGKTRNPGAQGVGHHDRAAAFRLSRPERARARGPSARSGSRSTGRGRASRSTRADALSVTGPERERGRTRCLRSIAASFRFAEGLCAADRGGDPAACGSRLGHAARACGRLGLCRACRRSSRPARHRVAARTGRPFRHRHRHIRLGGVVLDGGPAPGRPAAPRQPSSLPRRMARAADLR